MMKIRGNDIHSLGFFCSEVKNISKLVDFTTSLWYNITVKQNLFVLKQKGNLL